jgi:hypothetical protein
MERDFEKGSRGGGSVYNRRRTGSQNGNPGEFHCSSRTALGEMDLEFGGDPVNVGGAVDTTGQPAPRSQARQSD